LFLPWWRWWSSSVICGCACCLLVIIEKAVHTLKEHVFSIFPISNQPGGCMAQHPGYPDVASLVSDFYWRTSCRIICWT
jgi:hypothetical protein